jgi:hypothetical protein
MSAEKSKTKTKAQPKTKPTKAAQNKSEPTQKKAKFRLTLKGGSVDDQAYVDSIVALAAKVIMLKVNKTWRPGHLKFLDQLKVNVGNFMGACCASRGQAYQQGHKTMASKDRDPVYSKLVVGVLTGLRSVLEKIDVQSKESNEFANAFVECLQVVYYAFASVTCNCYDFMQSFQALINACTRPSYAHNVCEGNNANAALLAAEPSSTCSAIDATRYTCGRGVHALFWNKHEVDAFRQMNYQPPRVVICSTESVFDMSIDELKILQLQNGLRQSLNLPTY